jgi:transcriptional regulator GlxA family with amidase domain
LVEGADGVRVTDIALACGWGDIGQFSKDFTAGFGVSPSGLLKRSKIHGDA